MLAFACSVAFTFGCQEANSHHHHTSVDSKEVRDLKKELSKQIDLKETERKGRIALQKQIREVKVQELEKDGYFYNAIGVVESPFPDRRGTPRQPILVPAAKGKIRFDKKMIQPEHFRELAGFSHIWVVFVFHHNTNVGKDQKALASKIRPPRLHGAKVGCLSTRSPHRPNNIGLSVCKVEGVGPDYIELSGIDMVDSTPVLDIKPYIPYDVVPSSYPLPMAVMMDGTVFAGAGIEEQSAAATQLRVPSWVVEADIPVRPVSFLPSAMKKLDEYATQKMMRHCKDTDAAVQLITQVLRQDIRGIKSRSEDREKGSKDSGDAREAPSNSRDICEKGAALYSCQLDSIIIQFSTTSAEIAVENVDLASVATTE